MPRQTHPHDPKRERREAAKRQRATTPAPDAHWSERLCENDRWLVVQIERELVILEQEPHDEGARRRLKKHLGKVSSEGFPAVRSWLAPWRVRS